MAKLDELYVKIGADTKGLKEGMKKAKSEVTGFSSLMKNAFGVAGGMAIFEGIKKAFSAVGRLAKESVSSAMEVVESESLFAVSMGNMAQSARKWSDELQNSLGLNAYEVRKNVGLFYNMTTSMGLARNQAFDLSKGLTELAYDMSSFYNIGSEDMFTKLQSGISGEIEPLKRLGIIVNETTTKLSAYRNGIASVGAELTESQKVMARYLAIMDQTKNAQGDLARTINSPANQLRLLKTQLQIVQINIGQAFLPIVQIVLPILVNFAKTLAVVTNNIAQFMKALFGAKSAQTQTATSAAAASTAQADLGNSIKKAADKAQKGVAGFDEVNQLQEKMASNAEDAADGMDVAVTTPEIMKVDTEDVIPKEITKNIDDLKTKFKQLQDVVYGFSAVYVDTMQNVGSALSSLFSGGNELLEIFSNSLQEKSVLISEVLNNLIGGFNGLLSSITYVYTAVIRDGADLFDKAISKNAKTLSTVFNTAIMLSSGVLSGLGAVFSQVGKTFRQVYDDNIEPVKNLMMTVISTIANLLGSLVKNVIDPVFVPAFKSIKSVVDDIFPGIRDSISKIIGEITVIFSALYNEQLKPIVDFIANRMLPLIKPVLELAGLIFKDVFSSVIHIIKQVFKILEGLITFLSGVFTRDWKKAWEGISMIFEGVFKGLVDLIRIPLNQIIRGINNYLIKGLNSVKFDVPDWVPGIGGKKFGITISNLSEIPALAEGGIITKPTIAQIGERGAEAVMPLENTSFIDKFASVLGSVMVNALQFNQSDNNQAQQGTVNLTVDGITFARLTLPYYQNEQNRLGTSAIIQTV